MKLKFLLAIVSCSVIALSIGVPSIAETVKESQIKLEPAGIGNKDYRNKQSTPSIVGSWESMNGDADYFFDFKSDGTINLFIVTEKNQKNKLDSIDYVFESVTNEVYILKIIHDEEKQQWYKVEWISENEFIMSDGTSKRRNFVRTDNPVATKFIRFVEKLNALIEEKKEEEAAARTQQQRRNAALELEKARGNFNGAINNTGAIQRIYNNPYSSPF